MFEMSRLGNGGCDVVVERLSCQAIPQAILHPSKPCQSLRVKTDKKLRITRWPVSI